MAATPSRPFQSTRAFNVPRLLQFVRELPEGVVPNTPHGLGGVYRELADLLRDNGEDSAELACCVCTAERMWGEGVRTRDIRVHVLRVCGTTYLINGRSNPKTVEQHAINQATDGPANPFKRASVEWVGGLAAVAGTMTLTPHLMDLLAECMAKEKWCERPRCCG